MTVRVRIGMVETDTVLEVEFDPALSRDQVGGIVAAAMSRAGGVVWFEDRHRHRYGINREHLACIEVDDGRRDLGF